MTATLWIQGLGPMIDASLLEPALREALPPTLHAHAERLARLLADAANGPPAEATQARFASEPAYSAAFEALAGRQVGTLLNFGMGNQLGSVTVGDVAGGSILKFHILNVGGEVVRNLIVQDNRRQVFGGAYERLHDAYIAPDPVFERVRLDRFIGREWLHDAVNAFLSGNDRGYFILEAEAGLGKTAFLAHLAKTHGYLHLIAEQVRGLESMAHGLRSLAAQLIRAWCLQPYEADGVLPGAAARPDFLDRLLREASRVRDVRRPGEPIVLVVDGLDEAGTLPGQNVLGLPRVLPRGVFLIVSHRPVPLELRVERPKTSVRLRAEDRDNLGDMRDYLEQAASWQGIASALRRSGYRDEQFVTTLLDRCRGVWIYLHYIIEEIERGKRSPLNLETLPDGLFGYYAEYWRHERDADLEAWDQEYLPLLATLGAAPIQQTAPSGTAVEVVPRAAVQAIGRGAEATQVRARRDVTIDRSRKLIDFGHQPTFGGPVSFGDVTEGNIIKITTTLAGVAAARDVRELLAIIEQIRSDVARLADAPAGKRQDADDELRKAQEAYREGDRPRLREKLEGAQKILLALGGSIAAAFSLAEAVGAVLQRIMGLGR